MSCKVIFLYQLRGWNELEQDIYHIQSCKTSLDGCTVACWENIKFWITPGQASIKLLFWWNLLIHIFLLKSYTIYGSWSNKYSTILSAWSHCLAPWPNSTQRQINKQQGNYNKIKHVTRTLTRNISFNQSSTQVSPGQRIDRILQVTFVYLTDRYWTVIILQPHVRVFVLSISYIVSTC